MPPNLLSHIILTTTFNHKHLGSGLRRDWDPADSDILSVRRTFLNRSFHNPEDYNGWDMADISTATLQPPCRSYWKQPQKHLILLKGRQMQGPMMHIKKTLLVDTIFRNTVLKLTSEIKNKFLLKVVTWKWIELTMHASQSGSWMIKPTFPIHSSSFYRVMTS